MKIGGERKAKRVFAKNWQRFFNETGLGPATAAKRLVALAEKVKNAALEMNFDQAITSRIAVRCNDLIAMDWRTK